MSRLNRLSITVVSYSWLDLLDQINILELELQQFGLVDLHLHREGSEGLLQFMVFVGQSTDVGLVVLLLQPKLLNRGFVLFPLSNQLLDLAFVQLLLHEKDLELVRGR